MRDESRATGVFGTVGRASEHHRREARTETTFRQHGMASEYPRLQLWSAEEYFEGDKPDMPAMLDPYTGKLQIPDLFTTGS